MVKILYVLKKYGHFTLATPSEMGIQKTVPEPGSANSGSHLTRFKLQYKGWITDLPNLSMSVTYFHRLYKAAASLCVCLSVCTPPPFSTRPSDRNQIWHAYVDRSGNYWNLNKFYPPDPRGVPENCPENQ